MRTADDAAPLRERLRAASRVAVIGGDFAALEVTARATGIGVLTTVIEVAPVPMARALGDELGRWFRRLHEHHGVVMVWGCFYLFGQGCGFGQAVCSCPGR
ncbi:FAD-dependent oxidoreductase [Streptomyces sp. P3]|uniref:FAD-dependent oxidoreductase n=1 Tax=Streptomyces sp. P3 TaxID=2135430 RepID=UPI0034679848